MTHTPLLSFIVLSYNYERYIGRTLESILAQTVQDFEIVVVDDCSRDKSIEVIRSYGDPRIRLLVNEHNIGGAASYNRAVEAARGEWLVNLDADDWIEPAKSEKQLAIAAADPSLDIIGSYISVVDEHGNRHALADSLEYQTNRPHEFGYVDTWIGANWLCRSSTMFRRAAHMRIGLDDPAMVRAPDYELWTRAVREGCSIAILPEKLTYVRQHSAGVTHADPIGTLLEMTFAMLRNIIPLAEARALNPSIERVASWVLQHAAAPMLRPVEVYRLLGMLMTSDAPSDYATFRAKIFARDSDVALERAGYRCICLICEGTTQNTRIRELEQIVRESEQIAQEYITARDYWHQKSDNWEREYKGLLARISASRLVKIGRRAQRVLRSVGGRIRPNGK